MTLIISIIGLSGWLLSSTQAAPIEIYSNAKREQTQKLKKIIQNKLSISEEFIEITNSKCNLDSSKILIICLENNGSISNVKSSKMLNGSYKILRELSKYEKKDER
jgi:hypothetical protein